MEGTVTAFDFDRGLGEVTTDDGEVLSFHCVEIADGSRSIEVGTPVRFEVMLKLGRREASDIARA
ncbi:MAG: cold shock domain-containing protein [Actinomycetes bacterium]